MTSTALTIDIEPEAPQNLPAIVTPSRAAVLSPIFTLEEALARRNVVRQYAAHLLIDGEDFGKIPGTSKNVLLKPGAEKLANLFDLVPTFVTTLQETDWTGANHGGEPFFFYEVNCRLLWQASVLRAECLGCCSSWESKYRYRKAERACPSCGKAAIRQSKPDKPGFYCWAKLGGCGATFGINDKRITEQQQGLTPNPDVADLQNTILKMAQKRALVGAVLLAVNASDLFTQDVDDMPQQEAGASATQRPQTQARQQTRQEYTEQRPDPSPHLLPPDEAPQPAGWVECPRCQKRGYDNQTSADMAIERMLADPAYEAQDGKVLNAYQCGDLWHVGHTEPPTDWKASFISLTETLYNPWNSLDQAGKTAWLKALLAVDELPQPFTKGVWKKMGQALNRYVLVAATNPPRLTEVYISFLCQRKWGNRAKVRELSCETWHALAEMLEEAEAKGEQINMPPTPA